MKLPLSVVNSTGTSSWEDVEELGTLKSGMEKDDKLFFSKKNLEGDSRVTVFVKSNETDPPNMIACSERLSKMIRKAFAAGAKQVEVMKNLINLKVIKNENGIFLTPEGTAGETFSLTDLAKGETIPLESLIA